jgi:ankyrin repeat protein
MYASKNGHLKVVKLLVSNLANVNIKNSNGTPLMLATKHNFFRYCKIFNKKK